jgi:hypothetical protein
MQYRDLKRYFPHEGEKAGRHRRPDGGVVDGNLLRMVLLGAFTRNGAFGGARSALHFTPVGGVRT